MKQAVLFRLDEADEFKLNTLQEDDRTTLYDCNENQIFVIFKARG